VDISIINSGRVSFVKSIVFHWDDQRNLEFFVCLDWMMPGNLGAFRLGFVSEEWMYWGFMLRLEPYKIFGRRQSLRPTGIVKNYGIPQKQTITCFSAWGRFAKLSHIVCYHFFISFFLYFIVLQISLLQFHLRFQFSLYKLRFVNN